MMNMAAYLGVCFVALFVFCGAQTTQTPNICKLNEIPVQDKFDESRVSKE